MTDKERRDERFLKLCKWMSEAREIAKILREECAHIERMDRQGWNKDADEYCKGIRSALFMLEVLPDGKSGELSRRTGKAERHISRARIRLDVSGRGSRGNEAE